MTKESTRAALTTLHRPYGVSRHAADDMWFPNGMVVLADDTLVLAESHSDPADRLDVTEAGELVDRRVWADLGPGSAPDGICADAEGAIWYASVPGSDAPASPRRQGARDDPSRARLLRGRCSAATTTKRSYIVANHFDGHGAPDGIVLTQLVDAPHAGQP